METSENFRLKIDLQLTFDLAFHTQPCHAIHWMSDQTSATEQHLPSTITQIFNCLRQKLAGGKISQPSFSV